MKKTKEIIAPIEWVDSSKINFILGFAILRLFDWANQHEVSALLDVQTNIKYEYRKIIEGERRNSVQVDLITVKHLIQQYDLPAIESEILELIATYVRTTDSSYLADADKLLTDYLSELL